MKCANMLREGRVERAKNGSDAPQLRQIWRPATEEAVATVVKRAEEARARMRQQADCEKNEAQSYASLQYSKQSIYTPNNRPNI
ncbi:hypothetical protein NDU88_004482 [Pleurodeles waltl]|uniref:Uncharacterized protein n=1 Tax=Pleurodeles waltl TaxID=8319 RepID=A0AAV7TRH3_PLEWA|nr:hypothetical protein NDU88_004482 [Pleurodeles waltl]